MSTESVWEAIVLCWSSVYTGLPDNIIVDEGSQFRKTFAELATLHDVNLQKTPVESHNSLGIGERYHKPLRDTYRKLKVDYPSMQRQLLLALSVKAMNDTLGPEGTVPSALVFGEFPSLRSVSEPIIPRPTLAERAEAALRARRYMSQHLARAKVKRALHHKPPPATDHTYEPGDEVLVWREKQVEHRIGEWLGPYTVVTFDAASKVVVIQKDSESAHQRFSVTQVKPFLRPESAVTSFMRTLHASLLQFANKEESQSDTLAPRQLLLSSTKVDHESKMSSQQQRSSAIDGDSPGIQSIQVTEIVDKDDPRSMCTEMHQAKMKEVRDLLQRGAFRVMLKEELPGGSNALTARFVLAIKSNADGAIKYIARYDIGGHRDKLKHFIVHGAQTLQASSSRLLLALALMHFFPVWTSDVKLADELWHESLNRHLIKDLHLQPTKPDPSLYFSLRDSNCYDPKLSFSF